MSRAPLAHRLLTRLLGLPEEINGAERCPTYLYRWVLLKLGKRGVYIHRFVGDDWSLDLHDHPKRFISVGLWGGYVEQVRSAARAQLGKQPAIYDCGCSHLKVSMGLCDVYSDREVVYRAPWIRTFPATHIHRLRLPRYCAGCGAHEDRPEDHPAGCYIPLMLPRDCWTLVIVLKDVRLWGFWHLGEFIPWRKYVDPDNKVADEMKACP